VALATPTPNEEELLRKLHELLQQPGGLHDLVVSRLNDLLEQLQDRNAFLAFISNRQV